MATPARASLVRAVLRATPRSGWWAVGAVAALAFVAVPVLHLVVPATNPLHLSDYSVAVAGKIACYATVAVALDLVWGYAGILSLGHGLFFALGGYAFGMYLMRAIGHDGVYQSDLPDFMVFLDWKAYPWYWQGTQHAAWAISLVILVPGLLALVFGWFAFRSKIRGVYLSIITQALTYAAMLLFFRNDTGFGGNNGFTDFKRIFGFPIAAPGTRVALFAASVLMLLLTLLLCRWLTTSSFGRVLRAVRDGEARLASLGYDPLWYKLVAWTASAVLCALAGALYVPQVGIINPSEMSPANSIEIAIWVAVGGRGTLLGAAVGAVLVNLAKSWFTKALPELWLFFLGALFVAVTLFLPGGVVGTLRRLRLRRRRRTPDATAERAGAVEEVVA
ncbi:MAG TPA: urea ABC transporter permease subunit UrtC [Anaeromyxobacter sp.]|nr:urea ABC transporter permease subunit UrtC [Anaeromyxobacter sp.]